MADLLCAVASLFVFVVALATHPTRAQCPLGFHNNGVRPSGAFVCVRNPIGDDHRNARGILVDDSTAPSGVIYGSIYCRDAVPVVDDDRSVRCMPRDFVSNGWR